MTTPTPPAKKPRMDFMLLMWTELIIIITTNNNQKSNIGYMILYWSLVTITDISCFIHCVQNRSALRKPSN